MKARKGNRCEERYLARDTEYERGRTRVIGRLLPQAHGSRFAMDLGCGSGHFSRMLADRGWQVTAVDSDARSPSQAVAHPHRTVHGSLPHVLRNMADTCFDLILALEIVEHFDRSVAPVFLRTVRSLLSSRGTLVISTPNRHSLQGVKGYYWREKVLRGSPWTAWDQSHRVVYSCGEFLRLLRRCGLTPREIIGYWHRFEIRAGNTTGIPPVGLNSPPLNRVGFNTIVVCGSA